MYQNEKEWHDHVNKGLIISGIFINSVQSMMKERPNQEFSCSHQI